MPSRSRQMYSAIDDIVTFNNLVGRLAKVESIRDNKKLTQARKDIAPKLGVSPSTLENYRIGRIKSVPNWLMETAREILVKTLRSEKDRLEYEIQIHKQTFGGHRDDALAEAETALAKARQILREK
jgi:transcriptional regulator with XRE-family HTH domain